MMKHVPGPWKVYQERPHYYSIGTDYVNDHGRDQNIVRDIRCESNARVMAAAPELLDVLKKIVSQLHRTCVSDMDSGDACCVAVDEAKRIIAKAEGR